MRTDESYVTALKQVVARRPGAFPVVQLTDLTAEIDWVMVWSR